MRVRHAAGLAFSAVLGLICYGAWLKVPGWLGGTVFRDLSQLASFGAVVVILGAGERLWRVIGHRFSHRDGADADH